MPMGVAGEVSRLGCMQGQGVRAPDSNQDKVIGVELGRQDLTRPFSAKGEQESPGLG